MSSLHQRCRPALLGPDGPPQELQLPHWQLEMWIFITITDQMFICIDVSNDAFDLLIHAGLHQAARCPGCQRGRVPAESEQPAPALAVLLACHGCSSIPL